FPYALHAAPVFSQIFAGRRRRGIEVPKASRLMAGCNTGQSRGDQMKLGRRSPNSSLNKRVMLVLGAVLAILFVANGAIFGLVIWPAFVDVEQSAAQKNVNRVADALAGEKDNLQRVAHDWSAWDPTYEYVVHPNDEYDRQS